MKNIIIIICGLFVISNVSAQSIERQLVGVSGGYYKTTNVEILFSVGEAVINSFSSGTIILSQGFQQGSNNTISTQELVVNKDFSFYPNPVNSTLFLNFKNSKTDLDLEISVYNMSGLLVFQQTEEVFQGAEQILSLDLSKLSVGNYFVRLVESGGAQSSIKIVKVD